MSDILASVPNNNIHKDILFENGGSRLRFEGSFAPFLNYGGGYQWGTEGLWHISRGGVDLPLSGLYGSHDPGYFFIFGGSNNVGPVPFDFTLALASDIINDGDTIHFELVNTYWYPLQQRFYSLKITPLI
jgi:hypothetical protein